jgi:hypothetical protein
MPNLFATINTGDTSQIIIWSLILIGVLVAGFAAVAVVKRWLNPSADALNSTNAGFTLSDLRRMHREGEISDLEFEKAKARIIGAAKPPEASKVQTPVDDAQS